MRHFKIALGLAAVALTVSATPALAHEFKASKTGKTHGVAFSEQVFKFGAVPNNLSEGQRKRRRRGRVVENLRHVDQIHEMPDFGLYRRQQKT